MPTVDELSAMTVNERLFATGTLDAFDDAMAHRDEVRTRSLLLAVGLSVEDIQAILSEPTRKTDWSRAA